MHLITLLQELANTAHHRTNIATLTANQPIAIQQAFLTNNAMLVKNSLGDTTDLADRDKVTQL